jgi:hypothetical protein
MHQGNAAKSRCRNRRGSMVVLPALFALAGAVQALTPASAAALINQSGDGTCVPISGTMGVGWNGSEFCAPDGGGAEGSGGEATGGGSEPGTQPGEVIEVTGTAPSRCVVYPSECLPSQVGGPRPTGAENGFQARSPKPTRPAKPAQKPKQAEKKPRPGIEHRIADCKWAYRWLVEGRELNTQSPRGTVAKPWYRQFKAKWDDLHKEGGGWDKLTSLEQSRLIAESEGIEVARLDWFDPSRRIDSDDTGCESIIHQRLPGPGPS